MPCVIFEGSIGLSRGFDVVLSLEKVLSVEYSAGRYLPRGQFPFYNISPNFYGVTFDGVS